jgi:molybdenum cofactor cytidylyltransferase
VVLAAGESLRMGRDKSLLPWPPADAGPSSQTFLSAAIRSLTSRTDMVVVVVGKNEQTLAPMIYGEGASLVRNPAPERGQFSSMQMGLQEVLNRGRDSAIVTLVDRPPVNAETLDKLLAAFDRASAAQWAIVPEHGGKHGHPILLGREMIEAFLRAPASSTARDVEHQHQSRIEYVLVDDPFTAVNVNTPADYAALGVIR